jgi:hypothetical protein
MMSEAYRRSANGTEGARKIDPANNLLSHMNRRRLDAEEVRDAVLEASGSLNLKMGGAPVVPPLEPEELYGIIGKPESAWAVTPNPEEHTRRSVYLIERRTFQHPMFAAFDAPDGVLSCSRRNESTTAPQSLAFEQPLCWSRRACWLGKSRPWTSLGAHSGRDPRPKSAMAPKSSSKADCAAGRKVAALMARGLLNANEFLYVD